MIGNTASRPKRTMTAPNTDSQSSVMLRSRAAICNSTFLFQAKKECVDSAYNLMLKCLATVRNFLRSYIATSSFRLMESILQIR